MARLAAPVLLVAALLVCASATSLVLFGTCPSLLNYYHLNAIRRASQFARVPPRLASTGGIRRRGPGGRGRGGRLQPVAFASAPEFSSAQAFAASPALAAEPILDAAPRPEAGADFSDTNVQVDGVDEPDIVKTDGKRVFVVRGRKLSLVRASAAGATGSVVASLDLPTGLREILIEGDTVLLIGSDFGELDRNVRPPPPPPPFFPRPRPRPVPFESLRRSPDFRGGPVTIEAIARLSIARPFFGQPLTVVYRVSASGDRLRLLETLRMQGSYVSAREVRGVARIVTTYTPRFNFYYPVPIARGASAPADAARAIRASTLDTWIPRFSVQRSCASRSPSCARTRTGYLVGCGSVYHPRVFSGFGLLTVTTLRMTSTLDPRSTAVVSDGRNVYATASSLYVATNVYRNDYRTGSTFSTSFHKFVLGGFGASYAGSGSVTGSVLNQFSMHEQRGTFFVATTVGAPWGRRDQSRSKVTSFRQVGRSLQFVGSVGNLGVGERIFAVRYVGALAYVVTFRQVDPLYVLDIRNPAAMRVTGELKIPGFSSYLHPLGGGKLLGVGRDATPDGRTTGAKVSLFDVSDVTNPRELSAWTLDGSYSSARWDHRAFLYWAPTGVAVLPLSVLARDARQRFSGSIVLKVSANSIVEQGRISHPKCCGKFATSPRIERNFVLGRTNLWSLSQKALQVNDIRTLAYRSIVNL